MNPPPTTLPAVTPEDSAYRLLRSTYTTQHSPSLILLPRSVTEVSEAVSYAAATDLPVSIRSGGHGLPGLSSNDGGIVIDLSAINDVTVQNQETGLVRVGAGARWAQVASALAPHDLAISSGDHGNVGVGGLATAGGLGWLVRSYGLTIDHVRAATVVLPSGEIRRADITEPDLLWAVRGAGSYVGVVTDLDIEATRLPGIHVGQMAIEIDQEGAALQRWSEAIAAAPHALTMSGILTTSGDRLLLILTVVIASEDSAVAEKAIAPVLDQPDIHSSALEPARYPDLVPPGHLHPNVRQQPAITTNALLPRLTATSAKALVETARHPSRPLVQVRAIGGAANDLEPEATAYPHRDAEILVTTTLFPPQHQGELEAAMQPLWPHALGAYRGFDSHPTNDTFERAFPGTTGERVRKLAQRYDPDEVLRRVETG